MANTCTVCRHANLSEINQWLAANRSFRHIASQFGINYRSVGRHASTCIANFLDTARETRAVEQAVVIEAAMHQLYEETREILNAAQRQLRDERTGLLTLKENQLETAKLLLAAIKESRGVLDTLAKLRGEFTKAKSNPNTTQAEIDCLVREYGYTPQDAARQLKEWFGDEACI